MKLLLDENLPRDLKQALPGHDVSTVRENGWSGKRNGELLRLMIDHNFDCLLTFDQNLQHQQNFIKYPVAVIVLIAPSNKPVVLLPLMELVSAALKSIGPGVTIIQNR